MSAFPFIALASDLFGCRMCLIIKTMHLPCMKNIGENAQFTEFTQCMQDKLRQHNNKQGTSNHWRLSEAND